MTFTWCKTIGYNKGSQYKYGQIFDNETEKYSELNLMQKMFTELYIYDGQQGTCCK